MERIPNEILIEIVKASGSWNDVLALSKVSKRFHEPCMAMIYEWWDLDDTPPNGLYGESKGLTHLSFLKYSDYVR